MRLMALLFALFFSSNGYCQQDVESPNIIILPAGTVHNGDYFAFGETIEISGVVNGDVYVLGSQVVIDGKVTGDVLAAGGSLEISGEVGNNIRSIGGQVTVSGKVGHNVTIVAGNAALAASANIGGNIVGVAGNVDLAAPVGSDATIVASNLRVSNVIKSNLSAYVGQMRLTSRARIGGDVEYTSGTTALIDPEAKVGGKVLHHPSIIHELFHGHWAQKLLIGSKVAAILMNFLYTLVIGIVLLRLFPRNLELALDALNNHTWQALIFGIVVLIVLPLASLILLMTILGAPFALTLIALNIIGFYTAKIYTVFWISNRVFPKIGLKPNKITTLCCGLIVYYFLTAIPYVGFFVALAAMLFGLGAGVIAQRRKSIFAH